MGRYPFPATPNGWYRIASAAGLTVGEVRALHYFGRELVLFRGSDGRARLFDAHCPHQGAHLGVGGRLVGDGIRCPFHGWCFDGEGRLAEVPGLAGRLPAARLHGYPVSENNGMVFAFYDEQGRAPDWAVPVFRDDSGAWTEWHSNSYTVRTHVQDMAENILDRAHFTNVHDMEPPGGKRFDVRFEGARMIVEQTMRMASGPSKGVEILARTTNCGPGMSFVEVDLGQVATLALVTHTPIDAELVALDLSFCLQRLEDEAAMQRIQEINAEIVNGQFRQDIAIWENKVYRERPLLTAADGPILEYRRWYRQFYSNALQEA